MASLGLGPARAPIGQSATGAGRQCRTRVWAGQGSEGFSLQAEARQAGRGKRKTAQAAQIGPDGRNGKVSHTRALTLGQPPLVPCPYWQG